MVPFSGRVRAQFRAVAGLAAFGAPFFFFAPFGACSRATELADEPDAGGSLPTLPTQCDGSIPEVANSGIRGTELAACNERPIGACQGSNDFSCAFDDWFQTVVDACQEQAECRAGGCVAAEVADDGCVESLQMTEPNSELVACLVRELGAYRCPCDRTSSRVYLGVGTPGCGEPCVTGEHICPAGTTCIDEVCRPARTD